MIFQAERSKEEREERFLEEKSESGGELVLEEERAI